MLSVKEGMRLYAVTDETWLHGRTLASCVASALQGGVTMVQLREKHLETPAFITLAREIKAVCAAYAIPFVINDNLEVAMAVDADGIHVGQDDLAIETIQKTWSADKIIGISAQTVAQAQQAQQQGASYLGVGAVFKTATKGDAVEVPLTTLKAITAAVDIPVCAIGGIHQGNLAELKGTGIDGVALVSEIFNQRDITKNTQNLRKLVAEF
jgi:thiamine-phosphate diphosphorylase